MLMMLVSPVHHVGERVVLSVGDVVCSVGEWSYVGDWVVLSVGDVVC